MGTKVIVQKLSGFAKFDMDLKISKAMFFHVLEECSTVTEVAEAGKSHMDSSMAGSKADVEGS